MDDGLEAGMHGFDPLEPGSLLAERYRIGEPLGSGGMSFVHRGTDEVLGREVAVKALVQAGADAAELQRVQSEIDLLATLSHRALVTLFDAGTAVVDGRAVTYLVMELVDGPTLAARTAHEPLEPAEIRRMAMDLTEALVVVHARGVVHRDIKPANILLAPSPLPGQEFDAKLADFGIASLVDAARVTATGAVLGTAAYLSPEQATGARVGPASDIYSLGLVLLETLTGHREYPGSMLESLVARQLRDPEVPHAIDDHWESLLAEMTARDPDARPTAAAVLERLAEAPNGTPLPLASAEGAATSVVPAAAAAGAAAGAAAAGAASAGAAPAGDAPLVDDAASDTKELAAAPGRRRRRGWTIAATVTAGVALLATALAFALQGIALPEPSSTPTVAETSQPPVETDPEQSASPSAPAPTGETTTDVTDGDQGDGDEPTPTPEPTPTDTTPTDPAPTEPAPEPEPTEPAPTEPAPTPPTTPEPTQPPTEPSSSAPPESGSG